MITLIGLNMSSILIMSGKHLKKFRARDFDGPSSEIGYNLPFLAFLRVKIFSKGGGVHFRTSKFPNWGPEKTKTLLFAFSERLCTKKIAPARFLLLLTFGSAHPS